MFVYFVNDIHIDMHLPGIKAGKRASQVYHRWMDENLLAADTLCIAGDIADSSLYFLDFLAACRDRYEHVVYIYGNHDIGIYDKEYASVSQKIGAMNNFADNMKRLGTSTHTIKTKFHRLDGQEIVGVNGVNFLGAMGSTDFSYGKKIGLTEEYCLSQWKEKKDGKVWKKWWTDDPYEIAKDEKSRLLAPLGSQAKDPDIILSHFAPLGVPVPDRIKNRPKSGFDYWDVSDIINMLPPGAIWHFGHTHSRLKYEKDGILYLNNPIGYPGEKTDSLGKFSKEDFLINIRK